MDDLDLCSSKLSTAHHLLLYHIENNSNQTPMYKLATTPPASISIFIDAITDGNNSKPKTYNKNNTSTDRTI
jgi:hypothetical protein